MLLANFLDSVTDTALAAHYGAAIKTNIISESFTNSRFELLAKNFIASNNEIGLFQKQVSIQGKTIREVINSGERKFEDIFSLLDKSRKFKKWISQIGEDQNLTQEYLKEITKESWVDTLPAKALRFIITTSAGVIDPNIGLVTSVADSFLVDKIFKGWKPSIFVSKDLDCFFK